MTSTPPAIIAAATFPASDAVYIAQVENAVEPAALRSAAVKGERVIRAAASGVGFNSKLSEFITRSTKPVS